MQNFRRIEKIDIEIPENKKVICLVGENGSGKSSLISLILNSILDLTIESSPDNDKTINSKNKITRTFSTGEIQNSKKAFALKLEWIGTNKSFNYKLLVKQPSIANTELTEILQDFGISLTDKWLYSKTSPSINASNDIVSKSVILYRPSNRFETPAYEKENRETASPTLNDNWENKRMFPFKVETGIETAEKLILDILLDDLIQRKPSEIVNKIVSFLKRINEDYSQMSIPNWPFRRIGISNIADLNNLSAGELDLLVTFSSILAQEIYIKKKYNIINPSGIVIIDEIDVHLHPELQEKAIPLLTEYFPNIRFLITTHSPFILRSLNNENSMVVRLPDGSVFTEDFKYWQIEDILNTVFNVAGGWSDSVKSIIEEFESLLIPQEGNSNHDKIIEFYNQYSVKSSSLKNRFDKLLAIYGNSDLIQEIKK